VTFKDLKRRVSL